MKHLYRLIRSSVLAHHGIEGQKWGVRNGPPYPLDRKTHTKVVREGYKRNRKLLYAGKLSKKKQSGYSHMTNKWERQWQEVFYASNLGTKDNISTMSDELSKGTDWWNQQGKDGQHYVTDIDVADVNWGGQREPGQSNNCVKCTMALEMRRRGIAATAGRSFFGQLSTSPQYWFDGVVPYKEKGLDNFTDRAIKVLGNNGSAALDFRYPSGGGHSIYAYFDKNGQFTVADGQSNKIFRARQTVDQDLNRSRKYQIGDVLEQVKNHYGFDTENSFSTIMRLDTASPNYAHMAEDSVIRTNYVNDTMNQMRKKTTGEFGTGLYEYNDGPNHNAGFDIVTKTLSDNGAHAGKTHRDNMYRRFGG